MPVTNVDKKLLKELKELCIQLALEQGYPQKIICLLLNLKKSTISGLVKKLKQ